MKPRYRRMLRGMQVREEPPNPGPLNTWHLYILECGDGSYYTGVTTDIGRRMRAHREGKASRYTRSHGPVALVHKEECGGRSQALSRECAVKSLSRRSKEALIARGSKPADPKKKKR